MNRKRTAGVRFRALTLAAALVAGALATTTTAWAHAVLVRSMPAADGVVAGPTITIELKFNSRVDAKRSRVSLLTADGHRYPLDIGPQPGPETIVAPAKDLTAGTYKLRWQVLAADGHITRGEFSFRVK